MIRFVSRIVLVLALGVFALEAAPRTEHVFIISIDGGSPAVMRRSPMPVLETLAREGAVTWTAQTIRPSITLPAHTSMLTGVRMEKHGINWNDWVPTNPVVRVPTIFSVAKAAGFSTAMFVAKEKFRHLLQPGTVDEFCFDSATAQTVLKSDSGTGKMKLESNVSAAAVAANAAAYIASHRPGVCFIHFADPDSVGHKFGWGSPEQVKTFAEVDAALGEIRQAIQQAGIAKHSVIIITADHGGHEKGHTENIPEDMEIPWVVWGQGVKAGYKITERVNTCDTAATAIWLLDLKLASRLDGAAVMSAFK